MSVCLGSARVCGLRVVRLNSACEIVVGANNAVVSTAIVRLVSSPEYETGDEFIQKNGCGDICLYVKNADKLKRMNLTMELCTRDMALLELLTGGNLYTETAEAADTVSNKALTSNVATITTSTAHGYSVGDQVTIAGVDATFNGTYTVTSVPTTTTFTFAKTAANVPSAAATGTATKVPNVIGFARRGVGAADPDPVSVELWTKAIPTGTSGACAVAGTEEWWRWVYPRATFTLGDVTHENGIGLVSLTGFADPNPNWGNGPFNDWPTSDTFDVDSPEHFILDASGPPAAACGYTTVPVAA